MIGEVRRRCRVSLLYLLGKPDLVWKTPQVLVPRYAAPAYPMAPATNRPILISLLLTASRRSHDRSRGWIKSDGGRDRGARLLLTSRLPARPSVGARNPRK